MHHQTLKSAVAKYFPMVAEGTDVVAAIQADEKGYSKEEIEEIMSAIADKAQEEAKPKSPATLNKKYEEWKVKPVYEDVFDNFGKNIGRKLIDFEKDAQSPIRTTHITPEKAEILNEQAANTLLMLYEVK